MSVLDARDLAIGYGRTIVARDIDLTLRPGSVTCLLGPNGVGKTTLFKTLLGLLPALGGTLTLDGQPVARLPRNALARRIAYVPQAHPSAFAYTIFDLVLMGRTAYLGAFRSPTKRDAAIAWTALESFGIAALAQRASTQVSGGQLQLALIARALAQEAAILVLDEPTASLDFGNRIAVLDQVSRLAQGDRAVLLSTHDPDQAFALAHQVALLTRDGLLTGAPDAVLTPERLSALYDVALSIETSPSGLRHVVRAHFGATGD